MASLRARYPILLYAFQSGKGVDGYRNEVESWSPGVRRLIFGVNIADTDESPAEGYNRLTVDRVLLVPRSVVIASRDRVEFPDEPGILYEVIGIQSNADRNPFGWNPGSTVKVRRIDG